MTKLYYGNGVCTVEGSEIKVIYIEYRGAIEIDNKNPANLVMARNNRIIILGMGKDNYLNELFEYKGEFKIVRATAISNAEKVRITIHKVMDYTELLDTKSEDMTTKSEDLSSTYVSGRKVAKTTLKQPYINNLNTSEHSAELYLQDGTKYDGYFHIHLDDNNAMTGSSHTGESQDLYYSTGKPTRNTGLPYGIVEQRKRRKIQARKSLRKNRRKY